MQQRQIGQLSVSSLGFGCMGLSEFYGQSDTKQGIKTIHRAFDLGVNFFDTADMYGSGENERLVGKALSKMPREQLILATKFGIVRDPQEPTKRQIDARAERVATAVDDSLKRLKMDYIDLYYLHRMDPNVPIEDTVAAMAEQVIAGKIRYIGLSEANPDIIERAHKVYPITAVQTELSLTTRDVQFNGVLETCRRLGIGFVPYSPLGRGLLTGGFSLDQRDSDDVRHHLPRFEGENLERNLSWLERLKMIADKKHISLSQLSLAWVLAQGDDIVPIPGTRKIKNLENNVQSLQVTLTADELAQLDELSQPGAIAGSRYPEEMLKQYQIKAI